MGGSVAVAPAIAPSPAFIRLRPARFVLRSILLGLLAGLGGLLVGFFIATFAVLYIGDPLQPLIKGIDIPSGWIPISTETLVIYAVVGAPLIESLFFPLLYWLTRRLPKRTWSFAFIAGLLAWIGHGGAWVNFSQGFGFMMMATYYTELRRKYAPGRWWSPLKLPYLGIVIAHAAWNGLILALMFGLRPPFPGL